MLLNLLIRIFIELQQKNHQKYLNQKIKSYFKIMMKVIHLPQVIIEYL